MVTIFDIKEADDKELLSRIETTLSTFPTLKAIYDQDFLNELVAGKYHFDNYLLWLLVSAHPFAMLTWETVNKSLNLLNNADAISHFRQKLRHRNERIFKSFLTELEIAGYYKEKGYEIELEPPIAGTKKNPDFKVEKDHLKIFFEVRDLFLDDLIQMEDLDTQVHGRFGKIDERFVFSVIYKPRILQMKHLRSLQIFVKSNLARLDKDRELSFPFSLFFPDEKSPLAEVKVWGRPKKLKHGYLAGLRTDAISLPSGGRNIRKKIAKKISQLPEGEANVIVVELGHLLYDETDILDALLGDETVLINKTDFSSRVVRKGDRIFHPEKNTRVSAVLYYKKKFLNQEFVIRKTVFHNPFAAKRIDKDFFLDKKVRQLVPVEEEDSYRMEWIEE